MTSEERMNRLEHFLAGWVEQSKAEHAENRQLWRDMKRELEESAKRTEDSIKRFTEEGRAQMAEIRAEFAERDRAWHTELAARDRVLDHRITTLVSAMGDFIRSSKEGR
jgi:hemerythrin-like domain-containing protein